MIEISEVANDEVRHKDIFSCQFIIIYEYTNTSIIGGRRDRGEMGPLYSLLLSTSQYSLPVSVATVLLDVLGGVHVDFVYYHYIPVIP